jgi:hypothetical protein
MCPAVRVVVQNLRGSHLALSSGRDPTRQPSGGSTSATRLAERWRRVSASVVRRPLIGIDQRPGTLIVTNLWRREAEPRFRSTPKADMKLVL